MALECSSARLVPSVAQRWLRVLLDSKCHFSPVLLNSGPELSTLPQSCQDHSRSPSPSPRPGSGALTQGWAAPLHRPSRDTGDCPSSKPREPRLSLGSHCPGSHLGKHRFNFWTFLTAGPGPGPWGLSWMKTKVTDAFLLSEPRCLPGCGPGSPALESFTDRLRAPDQAADRLPALRPCPASLQAMSGLVKMALNPSR